MLGSATRYADSLAGGTLGCNGYGTYDPLDVSVIAVGPDRYDDWACGQVLGVCGLDATTGEVVGCIVGVRQDSCPGCAGNHVDLSRAGLEIVCGATIDRCDVLITALP